jgi:alpha-beta hydrolase superfamily lysophospholipase
MNASSAALAMLLAGLTACGGAPVAQTRPAAPPEGFFENGDVRLSYRLDRPEGRGPFPAVVVGHGSGRMTQRDFQFYADGLRRRGFAVLRYDKRGVGASTGTFVFVGTLDSEQVFAPRGFDPRPTLESLDVPGLWLLGQADDSIPERNTVAILKELIALGRPFAFVEYPNADHELTDRSTDMSVPFWADIDRWLKTCCAARTTR